MSICVAVLNAGGKLVMGSVVGTSAATVLGFLKGLRGRVEVTFEKAASGSEPQIEHWSALCSTARARVVTDRGQRPVIVGRGVGVGGLVRLAGEAGLAVEEGL